MVIKKKKLFYDIGIRYVWILCIYVVMSISLNEIVVRGNDYIAQVTDSMLTGKPVVLQNILIKMFLNSHCPNVLYLQVLLRIRHV